MNKYFYPALFHKAEEGGFWITFPDFPECMTQGDDMEESYKMAVDALGLCLTDMERNHTPFPVPSSPDKIALESDTFLVLISSLFFYYESKELNKTSAKLLIPYIIWNIFATVLIISIFFMNL